MTDYNTDYSPHAISVEQYMKRMHAAFLKGNYEEAVVNGNNALVELRLAVIAIKHFGEQRKQRE